MTSLLALAILRFAPLGLLMAFCLTLVSILKMDLRSEKGFGILPGVTKTEHDEKKTDYYLVVQENLLGREPRAGERWLIGEKITVGRGANNDIIIDDPYVSTCHARIQRSGEKIWIQDLKSTNGTRLNGTRITGQLMVQPGDSVFIGGVVLGVERGDEYANCSLNSCRVSETAK